MNNTNDNPTLAASMARIDKLIGQIGERNRLAAQQELADLRQSTFVLTIHAEARSGFLTLTATALGFLTGLGRR